MKRIVFTVLITLWMVLNSFSLFAEEDEWTCSKCGKASSGNYCSNCGSEKPSGEWKCPNCGEVSSGNFCSICGTSRVTTNLTEDGRMEGIEDDSPEEAMQVYLNAPNEGVATEPAAEEAALGSWENNLLMEEHGALGELKANGSTPEAKQYIFDNVKWDRRAVKGIYVLDTVSSAPDDAYDISESKNRSVLGWIDDQGILYIAGEGGVRAPENSAALFAWFENAKTIDLSNLHTDYMNDCRYMFYHCYNLESLVLTGFRTDNVTKMIKMFTECSKLENLNLEAFHTDNVSNYFAMFQKCASLKTLDLTGFNTGNSKNFGLMFFDCTSLEQVQWNPQIFTTGKVKNMRSMFRNCADLKYIDISGFSMDHVKDTSYMFLNCESLQLTSNLNIDLAPVESHEDMFAGSSVEGLYGRNGEYLLKAVDSQAEGKELSAALTPMLSEQGAQENTELSISNQKSLYAPVVDTILGSHPDAYFLHTDFNNDGTLELLIEYEPYASIAEGTEIELFTIVDGKCISTGGTRSSHSSYYDTESGEGLYAVSGIQGCETKMEIHMYNNEFSCTVSEREIGDGSYYKNDNPVYMKPLSHFYNEQILPESADRYLSEDDVISLGQTGLELAKNEIYARHGRVFVTPYIEKYFRQQSWYQPTVQPEEFSDSVFNDYEAANIDFLVNEEAKLNEDYSAYDSDDTVLQYIPGGSSRAEDEYTDDELKLLALECYHQSYPEVIPDQISVSEGIANQVEVILWPPNRPDGTAQAPYAYYEVDRFGIGTNRMDGNVFVNLSLYEYVLSE